MQGKHHRAVAIAFALVALAQNNASAGDVELGKYLSEECVTCHQASGTATAGVPPIAGLPEDQFVALMNAYKNKQRDNPVMQTVAGRLSADDIAALASYFGGLKGAPDSGSSPR
jgi:cytochrome c